MKTLISLVVMVVLASISGCSGNKKVVMPADESTRRDVFQEITASRNVPGKALLKIEFPVKTFKGRFVTSYFKHSDPPYTVTVSIDGQSTVLTDEPVLEKLPDDFKKNPEAGTGWKYNFRKVLLLEPGRHHVTITVPLSDVVLENDVTLNAGINLMQITPVYNTSSSRHPGYSGFDHGLNTVQIQLNNLEL